MTQRNYQCKFGCGFCRTRKKVVTLHETHCTYQAIQHLQAQVHALQVQVKELQSAARREASSSTATDSLHNFNYVNDLDDLIEDTTYMQTFWDKVQRRSNTLPVFINYFFSRVKKFYCVKGNRVHVKGVIGKVNKTTHGVDGAVLSYTWYNFYDAFIPGVLDLIKLFYGELLYDQGVGDCRKRIKQDLQLHWFYKPDSDQYDTDKLFREACRRHKAAKLQIIPLLQQAMESTLTL